MAKTGDGLVRRALVVGAGGFPEVLVSEDEAARGASSFEPLPSVAAAVEAVARALSAAGITDRALLLDPDLTKLEEVWEEYQKRAGAQPLVLHFSGHGVVDDGELYLAVRGSERGRELRKTSIGVSSLLADVDRYGPPTLFLLDVCEAGQAVTGQLLQQVMRAGDDRPGPRNAWVIGACAAGETTRQARFSTATAVVLRRLADGWLDVSPALEHIPVSTLAAEIARELAHGGGLGQSVVHTPDAFALAEVPPFFANPSYAPDAAGRYLSVLGTALRTYAMETDPDLDLLHFATRAAGNEQGDVCQFSGRGTKLTRIRTWLEDEAGDQGRLLVVTGAPGSGKSALLGVVTCLLHPVLEPLRRQVLPRVSGFAPPPRSRVLVVHVRQLTLRQILTSLIRQLSPHGRTVSGGSSLVPATAADFGTLAAGIRSAGPTLVILDALDEATDPAEVTRELVLRLTREVPGCRVMLGTRPWWQLLPQLHEYARSHPTDVLALDPATAEDRRELAADLTDYLQLLLDYRYAPDIPHRIAERLAGQAETGAFLVAALYANRLLDLAASGQTPDEEQVLAELPLTVTDVLTLRIGGLEESDPWTRPVLRVLGHARGQGMPLELIHAAALAIADERATAGLPRSLEDTRHALRLAAFHLHTTPDREHRQLYRYFHQALAEHQAGAEDAAPIHDALIGTIPTTSAGTPDWDLAHPYLKHHAAAHAAAAGGSRLDRLLLDPAFLLHADPDTLSHHLHLARGALAARHAAVHRTTTAHHPQRHMLAARRSFLMLDAAAWRLPELACALGTAPVPDLQRAHAIPVWATAHTIRPAHVHTLVGHTSAVRAAAAVLPPDGRALAVTADLAGTVLVWDLTTGEQLRRLEGHTGWVDAVAAVVTLDGRALAITAGKSGEVFVWDLSSGDGVRRLTGHTRGVRAAAAATLPDGRVLAVTAGECGEVLVWDLATGDHPYRLTGHSGVVPTVATATLPDGRVVAVITDQPGGARLHDLATGEVVQPFGGQSGGVTAMTTAVLPDGRVVAVTADGWEVRVRDLVTDEHLTAFDEHSRQVWSVATAVRSDGRPVCVSTGTGGQVFVRDLLTGENSYELPFDGGEVFVAATAALPDGRVVALTGGSQGRLVVWALDAADGASPAPAGGVLPISAATLPDGRTLALAALDDGIRVWDTSTGTVLQTFTGHTDRPVAAATAVLADGRALAVTADREHVLVWDLVTGEHLGTLGGHAVWIGWVATAVLPDGRALVVSAAGEEVLVHDLTTGEHVTTYYTPLFSSVYSLATAVMPDGRALAVIGLFDGQVLLQDLTGEPGTSDLPYLLTEHTGWVHTVAVTALPDGRAFVLVGGEGGVVTVWDALTREHLYTHECHDHRVFAVAAAVLPDGRAVGMTAEEHGLVWMWDLATGEGLGGPTLLRENARALVPTRDGVVLAHGRDLAHLVWRTDDAGGGSGRQ